MLGDPLPGGEPGCRSFLATRGDRHSRGSVQRRAAAGTGGTGDTTGHLAASEHWLTKQQVVHCARPTSRLPFIQCGRSCHAIQCQGQVDTETPATADRERRVWRLRPPRPARLPAASETAMLRPWSSWSAWPRRSMPRWPRWSGACALMATPGLRDRCTARQQPPGRTAALGHIVIQPQGQVGPTHRVPDEAANRGWRLPTGVTMRSAGQLSCARMRCTCSPDAGTGSSAG